MCKYQNIESDCRYYDRSKQLSKDDCDPKKSTHLGIILKEVSTNNYFIPFAASSDSSELPYFTNIDGYVYITDQNLMVPVSMNFDEYLGRVRKDEFEAIGLIKPKWFSTLKRVYSHTASFYADIEDVLWYKF